MTTKLCPDCKKVFVMDTMKARRCKPCRDKHNKETHRRNWIKNHNHNDITEMLSICEARVNIGRTCRNCRYYRNGCSGGMKNRIKNVKAYREA